MTNRIALVLILVVACGKKSGDSADDKATAAKPAVTIDAAAVNALVPAAAVLFLVGLVAWNAEAFRTLLPTAGVISLFFVVAWLPNWLVTLNPMVMIDNFVWIVVFLVLSLVIAAAAAVRSSRYLQHSGHP